MSLLISLSIKRYPGKLLTMFYLYFVKSPWGITRSHKHSRSSGNAFRKVAVHQKKIQRRRLRACKQCRCSLFPTMHSTEIVNANRMLLDVKIFHWIPFIWSQIIIHISCKSSIYWFHLPDSFQYLQTFYCEGQVINWSTQTITVIINSQPWWTVY